MNPLKAIVIDEERPAGASLTSLLELYRNQMAVVADAMRNAQSLQRQLSLLIRTLKSGQTEKIMLSTQEGMHFINVDQIVRVEGEANYSTFFLDTGEKIVTSKNLKFYQDLLPDGLFFRAHQSHMVNIGAIRKIKSQDGNTIELTNGISIPLAKKRKEALLDLLKKQ